jgi:phenylacetate-CoA ligase
MDLYGRLLANALFPVFEAVRGRPTVPLLRYVEETELWSPSAQRELQAGLLRRLVRHAYQHTPYYRRVLDERGLRPQDISSVDALAKLPLLDRATLRATMAERTSDVPPSVAIRKTTSGSSGQPVEVLYNVESRHWRDAIRWRGYGWGGYRIGMRALHYWGFVPAASTVWWKRAKTAVDHWIKRDFYVDCTPRGDDALAEVVEHVRRFRPQAIVAYASGAGALARFVEARGLRAWDDIPVLTGAEGLVPHDRAAIERAFGPVFETYGCREVMLMAAECEAHDGLHVSMENLIVELLVREPDGRMRTARPGETGEVVITDLHNLACPMIRYVNGDLAIAGGDTRCACGRGLPRIGPIEGRVTDTMVDGAGRAVGGLVFNILFSAIGHVARSFQVVQRPDRSVVFKVVPFAAELPSRERELLRTHAARYLPGVPFAIEIVENIPLSAAGKRRVVIVER